MKEQQQRTRSGPRSRLGRAYQGAIEAVLAVVIAAGLGAWVDSQVDTAPVLLLVGLAIGFAAFILRLVRLLKELEPPADGDAGPPGE